jgi:hypothetical protein
MALWRRVHQLTKLSRCGACFRVCVPKPSHRAASAAKGKGSVGPVRRLRETGTLDERLCNCGYVRFDLIGLARKEILWKNIGRF